MNKELKINYILAEGLTCTRFQTALNLRTNIRKHLFLNGKGVFYLKQEDCNFITCNNCILSPFCFPNEDYLHRQLTTILPLLIISSIKQKLTLEPNETPKSACYDSAILSGDLHKLLNGVSVSGITFLVSKSN